MGLPVAEAMLKLSSSAALAAVVLSLVAVAPAAAAPYEAFIDIETLEDLDDLLATGQITTETYDALYTLMERGVRLDTATRAELYSLPNLTYEEVDAILEYRELNGFIRAPEDLVVAGVLTDEKLLAIAAFLIIQERGGGRYQPHGHVHVGTRAAQNDSDLPSGFLRARVRAGKELTAGLGAVLTRRRIGEVTWDPNRDALIADAAGPQLHLPKAFVRYRGDKMDAIAGTYRIGFGERLTFDTATDYTPNGIYLDDQITRDYDLSRECSLSTGELAGSPCPGLMEERDYVTPDYGWSDGLRGIAVGTEHIELGAGRLQAFAWGSYQHRGIYQYEIANTEACPDPRNDVDGACKAPVVLVRPEGGDPLASTAAHAYQTLPEMFAESLVGANLTYFAARRDFVGVTGYGATTQWLPDTPASVRLDTQEWSRWPIGGRYGAIGAQVGIGRGIFDIFGEVTHSFDRMPDGPGPIDGGGGPAAVLRVTRNQKENELELSARYFDADFVNPYSGALAAADELEGHRGRGEHGVRAKLTRKLEQVGLRLRGDLWRRLVSVERELADDIFVDDYEYVLAAELLARADVTVSKILRYGGSVQLTDKGLGEPQRFTPPTMANPMGTPIPPCYEIFIEDGQAGEPATCTGRRLATRLHARYAPSRDWHVLLQLAHNALDSGEESVPGSGDGTLRHDLGASVKGIWRPDARLRLESRIKFEDYDVADNTAYERTVHAMASAVYRTRAKDQLRVRADLRLWLDDRTSTQYRDPSPEVWLGAEYQAKF